MRLLPGLAPFRHRDYAIYWTGQAISQSGTWMEVTATSWLLYELTNSPVLLGLGGLVRAVPILLLAVVGGAVADRFPRRRIALASQFVYLCNSIVLGTLIVTGQIQFWQIYIASAVNSTVAAFEQPARSALVPSLVPRAHLQNAIALTASIFRGSTMIGPALAGTLIATVGIAAPYYANAASFLASIVALSLIRVPDLPERVLASLRADAVGGIRYVLASPILPLVLTVEAIFDLFGHNSALFTIFARDVLGVGAQGLGLMLSAVGAGALLGIGGLVVAGDVRRKGLFMIVAGSVYATALLLFAWSRSFPLTVAILVCLGVADASSGAMRNTVVQLAVDEA